MSQRDTRAAAQINALQNLIDSIREDGPVDALVIRGVANVVSDEPIRAYRINCIESHFANTLAVAHMLRQAADALLSQVDDHLGSEGTGEEDDVFASAFRNLMGRKNGYDS